MKYDFCIGNGWWFESNNIKNKESGKEPGSYVLNLFLTWNNAILMGYIEIHSFLCVFQYANNLSKPSLFLLLKSTLT